MDIGTLLERNNFNFEVTDEARKAAFEKVKAEKVLVLAGAAVGTTVAECRKFMEDSGIEQDDITFLRRFVTLHPEVTVRYTEVADEDGTGPDEEPDEPSKDTPPEVVDGATAKA